MANFNQISNPTPYGIFDSDTAFANEADNLFSYVKYSFGDEVLDVELGKKTIFSHLEQATLEFGAIVNEYQAKSQLADFLGFPTGSFITGSVYPRSNLEFTLRQAEPYATEIGVGGVYNSISGSIQLENGRQDYDIYDELMDSNGNPIFMSQQITGSRGKLKIYEVYHFQPDVSFLALTTSPAINYLSAEFNFESFSRGTHFYVLPVFEDHLRMSMYDTAFQVRRSNYTYQIYGSSIRIFPKPKDNPKKLFIRLLATPPDPLNATAFHDDSVYGISNLSNIPFAHIPYNQLNNIGQQWVRKYTLALCKETLGLIRRKISRIPIPGSEMELDGASLVTEGREEKTQLIEQMRETLESLTYYELSKKEADEAENINRQLKFVPFKSPIIIG